MDAFSPVLALWIQFHEKLGVDMNALLLDGARASDITCLESELKLQLPEELKQLYLISNGQRDAFKRIPDNGSVTRTAFLFGEYSFLSIEQAIQHHHWKESIFTGEFADLTNTGVPSYREGDPIDLAYWQSSWFTFAAFEGNGFAVDLDPPEGGVFGQVIAIGSDEEHRVLANSLTDFVQQASTYLDIDQPGRVRIELDSERANLEFVGFDMDWRSTPPIPPTIEELRTEAQANEMWQNQLVSKKSSFHAWIVDKGFETDKATQLISALEMSVHSFFFESAFPPMLGFVTDPSAVLFDIDWALSTEVIEHFVEHGSRELQQSNLKDSLVLYSEWSLSTGQRPLNDILQLRSILEKERIIPADVLLKEGMAGDAQLTTVNQSVDNTMIYDRRLSRPFSFD